MLMNQIFNKFNSQIELEEKESKKSVLLSNVKSKKEKKKQGCSC